MLRNTHLLDHMGVDGFHSWFKPLETLKIVLNAMLHQSRENILAQNSRIHYHERLGLLDKGSAIKGFVVSNSCTFIAIGSAELANLTSW